MKKTVLFICSIASFLLISQKTTAQSLQSISIQSGFNADVIANGVGVATSSTSIDVDGVNFVFISKDFKLTSTSTALTYGLPINGLIPSEVASPAGLNYQLAPYGGNNSLRLLNDNDSGNLVFTTPLAAFNLYMLATGGSGDCYVNATVNFTDATTQTFSNLFISDWFAGANFAIKGIGRVNLTNNNLESGGGENPRLYQVPLAISVANQSKLIQSVTITKVGTGGIPNIFALSADAYTSCSGPTNIVYTSTNDGGVFNWTAPSSAPASGYDYYYSTSSAQPTTSTVPNGSVAAGVTTVTVTGLTTGATYYMWVRSNCGAVQGFWQLKAFVTGQMITSYTAGDINTEYNFSPTATSTTLCPGSLTINVPAGYQIASTAVSYTMTTASNGWLEEQKTLLVCTTNNTAEAALTSGVGNNTGTYSYNRTGLGIANGLTGNVSFQLRAWRTYGGSGCNADYNKVDNNSWKLTVTLQQVLATADVAERKIKVYPMPFSDIIYLDNAQDVATIFVTDVTGKSIRTIKNPQESINLGDLNTGLYILSMTMKDGSIQNTKAIKK